MLRAQLLETHKHGGLEKDFSNTSGLFALSLSFHAERSFSDCSLNNTQQTPAPAPALPTCYRDTSDSAGSTLEERKRQSSLRHSHSLPAAVGLRRGQGRGRGGRRRPQMAQYHRHTLSIRGRAGREEQTPRRHGRQARRGLLRLPAGTCQSRRGAATEPALGLGHPRPAATPASRARRAAICLPPGCQAAAAGQEWDARDAAPLGAEAPVRPAGHGQLQLTRPRRSAGRRPRKRSGRLRCASPLPPPGSRRRGGRFASPRVSWPGPASPHHSRATPLPATPPAAAQTGTRARTRDRAGRGGGRAAPQHCQRGGATGLEHARRQHGFSALAAERPPRSGAGMPGCGCLPVPPPLPARVRGGAAEGGRCARARA